MSKEIFPPFISDVHTHRRDAGPGCIINIDPGEVMLPGRYYSVGIHPWHLLEADESTWDAVKEMALDDRVLAIGETGIDMARQPVAPADVQRQWLLRHISLSEELGKPLIIHVVKGLDTIMQLKKQLKPRQPWIWHGFRGKPEMARQLTDAGIFLSLGERYNPDVVAAVAPEFLLHETD